MIKPTIINPKLLHKSAVDDVLLTNPRKVIPSQFIGAGSQRGKNKACEAIDNLYHFEEPHGYTLQFPPNDGVVTGLPFSAVMEANQSEYPRAVPHQVITKILGSEMSSSVTRTDVDDDSITSFLTDHNIRNRSTSFSFVNTGEHYFFYRKAHEHVPGIMLLEAARQAIYYQLYTYSSHKLGKVTVSLRELNAKFYAYGELMHPIEVVIDDLTEGEDEFPKEVCYSVSFYQRGLLIARIDSHAPVIPLNKFKIARNACLFDSERFVPMGNAPIFAIVTSSNIPPIIVSLYEISKDLSITSSVEISDLSNAYLTIIYDKSLFFHAPISLNHKDENSTTWNFGEVAYPEMENLKEMIKRGFVVNEAEIFQIG